MPQLKVIKSGLFSSVQDHGRYGVSHLGIPKSGVMDSYAFRYANLLLNNNKNDSVIELTIQGAKFQFSAPTQIIITGAKCEIVCNDIYVNQYQVLEIDEGDILTIQNIIKGSRVYIGIKGGFETETILNSKSFYIPITTKARLQNGDELQYKSYESSDDVSQASVHYNLEYLEEHIIEVFKGPEYKTLNSEQKRKIFQFQFTISTSSNRMAYKLEESLHNRLKPIVTSPVIPGTVQLTPSGQLIILMKDCQTTGGYPRILQVSERSLDVLAQKQLKSKIRLKVRGF